MERTANINLAAWRGNDASRAQPHAPSARLFAGLLLGCAAASAVLASWVPLQFSVVTVFLFAGPHNWFELRYFLSRLPVRLGRSRTFFLTAFTGIGVLTLSYFSLPLLYRFTNIPGDAWPLVIASWNTLLLLWLGLLVWLRGRNKPGRNWSWAFPIVFGLSSLNWLAPELFSLGIVYLHPLVALWFLDRHLARTRPPWLRTYRRCLWVLPLLLVGMLWQLGRTPALPDDNGLFWRITQHAGAQLLPGLSSHMLVATHVFLEMLHYGVWLLALPLLAPLVAKETAGARPREPFWRARALPVARHPRGFPKLVTATLALGVFLVLILWVGFSVDYSTTRDIYFTVAIAHVLAEAPFLLKMI